MTHSRLNPQINLFACGETNGLNRLWMFHWEIVIAIPVHDEQWIAELRCRLFRAVGPRLWPRLRGRNPGSSTGANECSPRAGHVRLVNSTHDLRASVGPKCWRTHRYGSFDRLASLARVSNDHGPAEGKADRNDGLVAQAPGPSHRGIKVMNFILGQDTDARTSPMPAHIDPDDPASFTKDSNKTNGVRGLVTLGEAMDENEAQSMLTRLGRKMRCEDSLPITGHERRFAIHHPIVSSQIPHVDTKNPQTRHRSKHFGSRLHLLICT